MKANAKTWLYVLTAGAVLLMLTAPAVAQDVEWGDDFEAGLKKAAGGAKVMFVQFTHAW